MNWQDYFLNIDLEKINKEGVHYEQKTTPDLMWAVCYSIKKAVGYNVENNFTINTIRDSEAMENLIQNYFNKPKDDGKTNNEYNKITDYQIKVLTFAKILSKNNNKEYCVNNIDAINSIAKSDFAAMSFLGEYTKRFIICNGFFDLFNNFQKNQTQANYEIIKEKYWKWAKKYTNVKTENPQHSHRVFNKIFNNYCYFTKIRCQETSKVTKGVCPYKNLVYNRKNFRDGNKPSEINRECWNILKGEIIEENGSLGYKVFIAKEKYKSFLNHMNSEITNKEYGISKNQGVHIHHILPKNKFPEFADKVENLVQLTPGQHLSHAHEKGQTKKINKNFQIILLIHKLKNIHKESINGNNFFNISIYTKMLKKLFNDKNINPDQIKNTEIYLKNKQTSVF